MLFFPLICHPSEHRHSKHLRGHRLLILPEHSLALCLGAGGPDRAGSGSLPPRPERSEVSPSVINQPGRDEDRRAETARWKIKFI